MLMSRASMNRMKRSGALRLGLLSLVVGTTPATSADTLVELGAEGVVFTQPAPLPARDAKLSLSLRAEFTRELADRNLYLTFEPFFRVDQYDEQRNHADIRELKAIKVFDNWELEGGVGQFFWGVAESNHLVDILNQTDTLEGIDGEDKLGQPVLRVSRMFDRSTLSAFVLPGFRERSWPGPTSRFALPFPVDEDAAQFESDDGNDHVDYALRYSGYAGYVDYGLSWFKGTARRPLFIPSESDPGVNVPFYMQMERVGLDLQLTIDAWLWKLEAIDQRSNYEDFTAAVGGLEYTFYNMHEGLYDLGLLAEYSYNSLDDPQLVFFQNDLFLGARFGFTDAESSQILAGGFLDLDDQSQIFRVEASRRVFGDATLSLEAQFFGEIARGNFNYPYRDNDFLLLDIAWYF